MARADAARAALAAAEGELAKREPTKLP